MQIQGFNTSNPAEISYSVIPKSTGCTLQTNEIATMKLIKKLKIGDDTCLVIGICRPSLQGLLVLCGKQFQPVSLLDIINAILRSLLGLLAIIPKLYAVNQNGCNLENNNCIQ